MFLTATLLFLCTVSASGSNTGRIGEQVESDKIREGNADSPKMGRELRRRWGKQVKKIIQ